MTSWANIYLRFHFPMQSFAQNLLKDKADAQDIVHDIFLHLLETKISPFFIENVEAYLRVAVYNRCISYNRNRKSKTSYFISKCAEKQGAPCTTEEDVLFRELLWQHSKTIHQLPSCEKEIYIINHFFGCKKMSMSILLGKSPKTIKKQLQVSKRKVRTALIALRA